MKASLCDLCRKELMGKQPRLAIKYKLKHQNTEPFYKGKYFDNNTIDLCEDCRLLLYKFLFHSEYREKLKEEE